jgi:hypothetical protein
MDMIFRGLRNTIDRLRLAVDVMTAAIDRQTESLTERREVPDSDQIHDYDGLSIYLVERGNVRLLVNAPVGVLQDYSDSLGLRRSSASPRSIRIILPEGTILPRQGSILVQ